MSLRLSRRSALFVSGGAAALAAVAAPGVVLRADGLVARLADRWTDSMPMVENYRFVAMLDPVELAVLRVPERQC